MEKLPLRNLLAEVAQCRHCEPDLPLGARPVVSMQESARILIIGQAPGTRVHATGIPWNDPSGDRLRQWMNVDKNIFYDASRIAIMPMGFCYPGKGSSGDLPPRPECAPRWHRRLLAHLPNIELTLLIGSYAQNYYLGKQHRTLTERVAAWRDYLPDYLPLVHPSPRNTHWLQRHPWFERELVPRLQEKVQEKVGQLSNE